MLSGLVGALLATRGLTSWFAFLHGARGSLLVIAGGESCAQARPLDLAWARSLRDQCWAADITFHFRQVGGRTHAADGRALDWRAWNELPAGPA